MTEKLKRFDSSRPARAAVLILLWAVLFALNRWTPYLADDFRYMFGFDTKKLLSSVSGLIPSMEAHARMMNGRVIAHGLEQLFLLMPKTVFNLLNAGAFLLTLWQACRFCLPEGKRSALLPLVFFAGIWLVLPVFGQVCLWQVGALNYLWSLMMALLFLRPFIQLWAAQERQAVPLWRRLLFLPFAFLAGSYSELGSLISILTALALTVLSCVRDRSGKTWLWIPLAAAIAGFWFMISMPAEAVNKAGNLQWNVLLKNIVSVTALYQKRFQLPTLIWAAMFAIALMLHADGRRVILSLVFFLAGIAATYELIAANYVVERCLCVTTLFLLIALGILFVELVHTDVRRVLVPAASVLTVLFLFSFVSGTLDVRDTHVQFVKRELQISAQKQVGATTIYIPRLRGSTMYSSCYSGRELNLSDPTTYPNRFLAIYYDVKLVVAKEK